MQIIKLVLIKYVQLILGYFMKIILLPLCLWNNKNVTQPVC
jgi:hypothetical protein